MAGNEVVVRAADGRTVEVRVDAALTLDGVEASAEILVEGTRTWCRSWRELTVDEPVP